MSSADFQRAYRASPDCFDWLLSMLCSFEYLGYSLDVGSTLFVEGNYIYKIEGIYQGHTRFTLELAPVSFCLFGSAYWVLYVVVPLRFAETTFNTLP